MLVDDPDTEFDETLCAEGNHGRTVSSVAQATEPGPGHGAVVSEAAHSSCGKTGDDEADDEADDDADEVTTATAATDDDDDATEDEASDDATEHESKGASHGTAATGGHGPNGGNGKSNGKGADSDD